MKSQFGKCNVCATPCASCVRLGPELLPKGSTSNCFSDESCKHMMASQRTCQTAAVKSLKCEEGIQESKFDENFCVRGAGFSMSDEYHRTGIDKKNETVGSFIDNGSCQQRALQAIKFEPASCCPADYHSEVDDESHCSNSSEKFRKEVSKGNVPICVKPGSNGLSSWKDFHVGPTSIKGRLHDCSMDHTESSSSITMVQAVNEDLKQDADNSAKTIKCEFAEEFANNSVNCSNHEENRISIEQSNVEDHCQFSEFVGCGDESALLDYVKVCDICGDAGREDSLAICSKCNDGAEHIYCMRTRLDKLPESSWICEECVRLRDKDKLSKDKFENSVARSKFKSSNQSYHGDGRLKGSDVKALPEVNLKGLNVEKSRADKVSSLPSGERTSGNVTSASMRKGLTVGTKSGQPLISKEIIATQATDFAIKPRRELSVPNDLSSRTGSIKDNASLPARLGNLTKSKSFNDSDKRPKILHLDELRRKQLSTETCHKKKSCAVTIMGKSLSFNDASYGCLNSFGPKMKRDSPKFSEDGDLKRLRYMKERSSVEMTSNSGFKRPQVGPSNDSSCLPASSRDMKFASHGESMSPDSCGTKEMATARELKKLCSRVTNNAQDLLSPTRSGADQELKRKDDTKPCLSLKSSIPLSCSNASGDDKLTTEKSSSIETQNAPRAPSTLNGSGNRYYVRSESLCHASHSNVADSSSASVFDTARALDKSGSSQINLGPIFSNQLNSYRTLAVPMFDYIWKGEFEIQSTGTLPRFPYRIQAHLSTRASSKIPEAVNKFSDKILLEEVPRLNAWPIQFQEYYPQDDSIGLYFFAEDIASYENYKSLLQCMVDYDLALRGNFNGIELLIFSSHMLPESFQYWNGLLFLWGVFKERKTNGS